MRDNSHYPVGHPIKKKTKKKTGGNIVKNYMMWG
jgi:hypothetical protein